MKLHSDRVDDFLDGCFSAGIKDPLGFLLSKLPQQYGYLKGAFPRGILPTDVDGEVEVAGKILRFEFKHEGALLEGRIPKGQMMYLKRLVTEYDFTVFIVGVDAIGEPTLVDHFWKGSSGLRTRRLQLPKGRADLRILCSKWSNMVSGHKIQ